MNLNHVGEIPPITGMELLHNVHCSLAKDQRPHVQMSAFQDCLMRSN